MAFSADWLALREPADAEARSAPLTRRLADACHDDPLRVVDLGTGAGANFRYLAARLPAIHQDWLLVDHDETLLAACVERLARWTDANGGRASRHPSGIEMDVHGRHLYVETAAVDLAETARMPAWCAGRALVTASALLDLVPASWLEVLAAACRGAGASVLFSLTYDGRISFDPADPADETIRALVNAHQHTDKGMGAAAGPDASSLARECFERARYEIRDEASDWRLAADRAALQRALIEGWAEAASAIAPAQAAEIAAWRNRRFAHLDAERSNLTVGHRDLAGWIRVPEAPD